MNQRMLIFLFAFTVFGAMVSCTKDAALNSELVLSTATNAQVSPTATSRNYPAEDCLLAGQELHKSNYPAVVTNYVQTNLSNARIDDVTLFSDNGTITYKVELKNETILVLDAAGNLLAQGFETELTIINIPQAIKDAIATSYPNQTIEEAEKGWTHTGQEVIGVELRNDTELLFDLNGTLLCTEQDQGNNDHNSNHNDNPSSTGGNCLLVGQELNKNNYPEVVTNYVLTNLPNEKIDEIVLFNDNGTITYKVELKNKTILILDATGNLLAQGLETDIAIANIPQAIKETIATSYPNQTIDKAEKEWMYTGQEVIEVELRNDMELLFDLNGIFLCSEQGQGDNDGGYNNDHDDDDVKLPTDLKALVEDYLATNFPGYILKEADLKSLCNGTPVAVATLKDVNGMKRKAYFALDLNITLLQTSTKILSTALPAAVLNTISSTYPNLTLDKDAKLIELPDGTLQYEVELESNGNSTDLDVILAADGTVVCQE